MSILRSIQPDVSIPDINFAAFVLEHASYPPNKVALMEESTGRSISYADLKSRVQALAGGLTKRGLGAGTTWALVAPNSPEYATAFLGIVWAGGTVTPVNPSHRSNEIERQLASSKATAVITTSHALEATRIATRNTQISHTFLIDRQLSQACPNEWPSFLSLFGSPMTEPAAVNAREDVAALPFSSGTTGLPKGVMLTHYNMVANICQSENHLELDSDDIVYAVLPFFHIYGLAVILSRALRKHATIIAAPRFNLDAMLDSVQDHRVTLLYAVPPMLCALASSPTTERDLSSLRLIFSGAAPLSETIAVLASKRGACRVAQGYGMTELSPTSHATLAGHSRPGSVGTLVANTELRLVDPDDGEDLIGTRRAGELWIRGPQVMKGYLHNSKATRSTIDGNGWLHTGDLARVDADGQTFIVGRIKELIKTNGFSVAPTELESVLSSIPDVLDVAVTGIPDSTTGERPKAWVVKAPRSRLTEVEVQQAVASRVARYKQLREVEFVESIPRSPAGKILRDKLT